MFFIQIENWLFDFPKDLEKPKKFFKFIKINTSLDSPNDVPVEVFHKNWVILYYNSKGFVFLVCTVVLQ